MLATTTTTESTEAKISHALITSQAAWLTARRAYVVTRRHRDIEVDQLRAARDAAERAFRQAISQAVNAVM